MKSIEKTECNIEEKLNRLTEIAYKLVKTCTTLVSKLRSRTTNAIFCYTLQEIIKKIANYWMNTIKVGRNCKEIERKCGQLLQSSYAVVVVVVVVVVVGSVEQ